MEVDQRYFWWHWGEQFFAMERGQCVGDATPGFARSAERTLKNSRNGALARGTVSVAWLQECAHGHERVERDVR